MFPVEKYRYFTNNTNLVIAEQTYAGKKYRAKAVCANDDDFDYEKGKTLAAARCNVVITGKRYDAALEKVTFLRNVEKELKKALEDCERYYDDAMKEHLEAIAYRSLVEKSLGKGAE